jgi:hypothetical protein
MLLVLVQKPKERSLHWQYLGSLHEVTPSQKIRASIFQFCIQLQTVVYFWILKDLNKKKLKMVLAYGEASENAAEVQHF